MVSVEVEKIVEEELLGFVGVADGLLCDTAPIVTSWLKEDLQESPVSFAEAIEGSDSGHRAGRCPVW